MTLTPYPTISPTWEGQTKNGVKGRVFWSFTCVFIESSHLPISFRRPAVSVNLGSERAVLGGQCG